MLSPTPLGQTDRTVGAHLPLDSPEPRRRRDRADTGEGRGDEAEGEARKGPTYTSRATYRRRPEYVDARTFYG